MRLTCNDELNVAAQNQWQLEVMMGKNVFELGLVGAGAISAGAYTGGVIDFMTYALDCWYAAKEVDPDSCPPHEVKISVFSGASAGGMTAALAVGYLGSDQPSITNPADAEAKQGQNKLFDSWVRRIDISSLLQSQDLPQKTSKVISLLDASVLPGIAQDGLNVKPRSQRRLYIAEEFNVLLTVTNLRGVPYEIKFVSNDPSGYQMSLHADYVRFQITDSAHPCPADRYCMTWSSLGVPNQIKDILQQAALASGAFPLGLAPRMLNHVIPGNGNMDWYSARKWPIPTPESQHPHQCFTLESIPVNWGLLAPFYQYNFMCVDGGVINNEPFELAHQVMSGMAVSNNREGSSADKAVILIDPFPTQATFNYQEEDCRDDAQDVDLLHVATALLTALKNQARFKPDELVLAADGNVYSRFMIAPSRDGAAYPIACGSLEGFGGFLKQDFRAHDYFLGRRNAQKFLRDHLVLPENNALFDDWPEAMKVTYCVKGVDGQPKKTDDGQRLLPIIPLVGAASQPCYQAPWPAYSARELDQLGKQIGSRVAVVLDHLIDQYFGSSHWLFRWFARWGIGSKKKEIVASVLNIVSKDLIKMQLLRE